MMPFHELQPVILKRDLPEHGLSKGDLGAVVEIYDSDSLEVEFIAASGRTKALVTVGALDVRAAEDDDLPPVPRTAGNSR